MTLNVKIPQSPIELGLSGVVFVDLTLIKDFFVRAAEKIKRFVTSPKPNIPDSGKRMIRRLLNKDGINNIQGNTDMD